MKNYVVAICCFLEPEIKLFKIQAENDYEAVKKGMLEYTPEKYKDDTIELMNSIDYPKDLKSLIAFYVEMELMFSVIELNN